MTIQDRRAIEALRSGVPNRDAVIALGARQPRIEAAFERLLDQADIPIDERKTEGVLVEGGFGAGKSHLLEHLHQLALNRNFVCSKISISKETPLFDRKKLFLAAVRSAEVPDARGAALPEIASRLDFESMGFAKFNEWLARGQADLPSLFAASMVVFEGTRNEPEIQDRMIRFWSGGRLSIVDLKRFLRAVGSSGTFRFDKVPAKDMPLHQFRFASRLMVAAGFSGWVLLVDEVELISRYSIGQRGRSYAELARWMGVLEGENFPGIVTVFAVTDDFCGRILDEKDDQERIPAKLEMKGTPESQFLIPQAKKGMQLLQDAKITLAAPDELMIDATYSTVRSLHAAAHGWVPPDVRASREREGTTRMREIIKGWITEWDFNRLDPGYQPNLVVNPFMLNYTVDPELERPGEVEKEEDL